ncbi:UDP-N-acetylglucosamine--dolichyl-phosphate N-acetylglucosaminephosphotransferase [Marchantia polymorpha subsp. ruderalis]|uniref:UDP-N-acetylglucosamine--dolichyl-phosphate N-acetylglucosaminephosphotransferase n=2 Tax=Marchantia polymorpha TaxID=3197 RepID=A0AAF6B7N7_MARPO|nr:hypothetical protein MARPO_0120s0027 [Marchantia polymorpha]BBN08021.1 hypothetical protein Mp_4g08190 [Marchantia polymorpha subsp. ruderalis]|eukprot:PTQ30751.1 hypothetical protein MARPO_0120s0027 [Marchantia polymorpha]
MARDVAAVQKRKKQDTSELKAAADVKDFSEKKNDDAPALTMKKKPVLLLALSCLAPYVYMLLTVDLKEGIRRSIFVNLVMSIGGFFLTIMLIPVASRYLLRKNMFGYDINKKGSEAGTLKVPESLGLVTGIVFLTVAIVFQPFFFNPEHSWLPEYNAALMCICFMLFLGFVDDVLDLPWRVKLLLPSIAALPLLMAYAGPTTILIPKPLQGLVGTHLLELGWVYKLYMGFLAVFCTNSVNILAGVNGLEVGQTIIIACAVLTFNIMRMGRQYLYIETEEDVLRQEAHCFSIFLMQPLVGASLALFAFNWYPSSVFVGDTFTYFAGMALAVVGILGHFSETLLVFFLPQVINFVYSVPQLFKFVYCPRHRLPSFDPKTKLLTGSNDLNLVNLFLRTFGRCTEPALCIRLLIFQVGSCAFCFALHKLLEGWYK